MMHRHRGRLMMCLGGHEGGTRQTRRGGIDSRIPKMMYVLRKEYCALEKPPCSYASSKYDRVCMERNLHN